MTSPVILLGADGSPQPPQDILRRLQAIDPKLGMKFVDVPGKPWAITLGWGENDRRMGEVRAGKANPADAYDVLGYLPADCSLSEAPAYIGRFFGTYPRADVTQLLAKMDLWNQTSAGGVEEAEQVLAELSDDKFGMDTKVTGKRTRHKVK